MKCVHTVDAKPFQCNECPGMRKTRENALIIRLHYINHDYTSYFDLIKILNFHPNQMCANCDARGENVSVRKDVTCRPRS